MAKGIPYGISDFSRLIDQNYYYVDKTHFIPQIEEIANYLFLIRPRRFGKSVFLTMMRAYYDISQKDRFEERFGNLWIGKHPTPLFQSKPGTWKSGRQLQQLLLHTVERLLQYLPGILPRRERTGANHRFYRSRYKAALAGSHRPPPGTFALPHH